MSAASAVIDRRYNFVIQRLGLVSPALAPGTPDVGPIAAEQNAHMHLVSLALKPAKEAADAVPSIVFVIFICVIAGTSLAVDDEVLIGLRQFFEWNIDIDLFACARSKQILLRFAKLGAPKNAHRTLFDAETSIGDRLVQVDGDGPAEAAALRTCAERVIKTEKTWRWRANVEIAPSAMPASGEGKRVISDR